MQTTSSLYKQLLAKDHIIETKVVVDGFEYFEDSLISVKTYGSVFSGSTPSVGSCLSREIDLVMKIPDVDPSRMASIKPYMRLVSGTQHSEWIQKGQFYIDTRDYDDEYGRLTIHGYDDILKLEDDYPSSEMAWPASDISVVEEIAATIGVPIDARTRSAMYRRYTVQLPAAYSMRETLGFIAAMYGGNFIMSDVGELLLVQLHGIPKETYYLINEADYRITLSGDRIVLLDEEGAAPTFYLIDAIGRPIKIGGDRILVWPS